MMSKRYYLVSFFGALIAFAVVAATEGRWIGAAIFLVIGYACLFLAGPDQPGGKAA